MQVQKQKHRRQRQLCRRLRHRCRSSPPSRARLLSASIVEVHTRKRGGYFRSAGGSAIRCFPCKGGITAGAARAAISGAQSTSAAAAAATAERVWQWCRC
eukprot:5615783-Alexandrium_andersonii.AAC.1